MRLYINDTEIDLFEDNDSLIAVTYSVADINNIDKRSAGVSKTIDIPLTKTNRVTMGFPNDINSSDAYDQNTRHTARIEADGVDILKGFAKVVGVRKNKTGDIAEVVVIGDNGGWKVGTEDKKLTALDLSDLDHVYKRSNIMASWSTNGNYVYPIINYGRLHKASEVNVSDVRPAINVKTIINKIFNEEGYIVESDFINGSFFSNLYFIGGVSATLDNSFRDSRIFRAGLTANFGMTKTKNPIPFADTTTSGFFQSTNNNFGTPLYGYTVDIASNQTFKLNYDFEALAGLLGYGTLDFTIELYRNGVKTKVWGYSHPLLSTSRQTGQFQTPEWSCLPGDTVYCFAETDGFASGYDPTITLYDSDDTAFSNDVSLQIAEGTTIDVSNMMPDATALDFIQGLKQLFNLYFYTDYGARKVYIEPRDDFYLGITDAVDWTDKVDVSKERTIDNITPESKYSVYKYKEDGDDINTEQYKIRNKHEFARYEHETTNQFIDGSKNIDNTLFAPTWDGYVPLFKPRIPIIRKDADDIIQDFECEPRIIYYAGEQSLKKSYIFGGASTVRFPFFTFTDFDSDNDTSLSFTNYDNVNGLFKRYYTGLHTYIDYGKLLTAYFYLKPSDILALNFRKPVLIDDTYYYINKIVDYTPGKATVTKVELLKLVNKELIAEASTNGNVIPPPYDKKVKKQPRMVWMKDTRMRPPTVVPVLAKDENNNIIELHTRD